MRARRLLSLALGPEVHDGRDVQVADLIAIRVRGTGEVPRSEQYPRADRSPIHRSVPAKLAEVLHAIHSPRPACLTRHRHPNKIRSSPSIWSIVGLHFDA